ncbi:hypothetical protein PILCRDRAFT_73469, partial [Piloderma croceum F 1598]
LLIDKMVPIRERGRYMGIMYARIALASILGPVCNFCIFTRDVTWRWCFYINLPIGGVAITSHILFASQNSGQKQRESHTSRHRLWRHFVVVNFSRVTFAGLVVGCTYPWNSHQVIALLVVGGSVFVVYEYKVPHFPIIPLEIFRHRNVIASTVNYFFTNMSTYGLAIYILTYFQLVKNDTQLFSGLILLA